MPKGEGKRDRWYWISGVPDPAPKQETMGVKHLILYILLHIELGHALARVTHWIIHLLPLS